MADVDYLPLLKVGPFKSFDSRTNAVYVDPNDAIACSNTDTHRSTGALVNFFGRSFFADFPMIGQSAEIQVIARYVTSPTQIFYIVQGSDNKTAYINSLNGVKTTLSEELNPFTQSVQSNGVLYLNNGQQIFLGTDGRLHVALWQYPAPSGQAFQYKVDEAPPSAGALEAATYYYAFVQVISIPMADGTVQQITSPTGAIAPYPYSYTATGTIPAQTDNINDPQSLIGIAPLIFPGISTGTTVTVTSTGAGTFNVQDTLGTFEANVPAGTEVTIGGANFTLTTVTDIPSGRQASFHVVPDSRVFASISDESDPDSILNGVPTVVNSMSLTDVITITSNGSGTFAITDSIGSPEIPDAPGGSTQKMGGATFTLTSSSIPMSDVATFQVNPEIITPASVQDVMDPNSIFAAFPAIVPNVPASTTITIKSNGDGTYDITDTLGDVENNVIAGSYVFMAGSYFALTYTSKPAGESATFDVVASTPGRAARISGIFSGTTNDGYPFVTQVYRLSTNQPLWFLLTTLDTNGEYFDTATDVSISGNQQLILNRDQPLVMQYPETPIAVHQARTWSFGIVNNANTNGFPQTQLMYSNLGQPWSFDIINQTQLVEDDDTPMLSASTSIPAGQIPTGMLSIGSALMLFKNGSTFLEYGVDSQTYQPIKLFPDIGLIGPALRCYANGLVAWGAAQGPFLYDGGSLTWIGKEVYNAWQAIPPSQQVSGVSFYGDQQIFFSFPAANTTFVYYLPDKTWTILPYATNSAVYAASYVSNPLSPSTSFKWNEIIAVRPGTNKIDAWLEGKENDLGLPTQCSWTSKIGDSEAPWAQKDYKYVAIEAPVQPKGTIAIVTFQADPGSPTAPPPASLKFDLSIGALTRVRRIPEQSSQGYACQFTVTFQTPEDASAPVEIYSVTVGGTLKRSWVQNTNG